MPRLINTLCDTSMMAAFAQERDSVGRAEVLAAIEELQWHEFPGAAETAAAAAAARQAAPPAAVPATAQTGTAGKLPALEQTGAFGETGEHAPQVAAPAPAEGRRAGGAHGEATQDHVEHSDVRPADVAPQVPEGPVLAHVLLAHGARTLFERALYPGRLIIGRTPNNDLQIDSKFISRHHCQILTTPTGSTIEDLNSRNGVFVKSKRVRLHHLNDGDVVTVGQHEILYIDERAGRRQG